MNRRNFLASLPAFSPAAARAAQAGSSGAVNAHEAHEAQRQRGLRAYLLILSSWRR